jgi:hypothetical protein
MTRVYLITFALFCAALSARAQDLTPSQTALQIDNVVNAWAQRLEADAKAIAELQKEIADLKAALKANEAAKEKVDK